MKAKKCWFLVAISLIFAGILLAGTPKRNDQKPSELPPPLNAKLDSIAEEVIGKLDYSSYLSDSTQVKWASRTQTLAGLEGVGIIISVEITEADRVERYGLTTKLLETQTQEQLRKHGIKTLTLTELPEPAKMPVIFLYINVNAQVIEGISLAAVNTSVQLLQVALLERKPATFCLAATWQKSSVQFGDVQGLKEVSMTVRKLVDFFINDYLAANPQAADDSQLIKGTGTIRYAEVEGGFYEIHADSGESYDPINLPSSYAKDGIRVKFTVRYRPDMVSIHMSGKIVEILKIEKLEKPRQKQ